MIVLALITEALDGALWSIVISLDGEDAGSLAMCHWLLNQMNMLVLQGNCSAQVTDDLLCLNSHFI